MDISIFLARVLGLYLLIISVPLFFNFYYLEATIVELFTDKASFLLFSILTLMIGILLIIAHNIWVLDWRIVITLLAWAIFIKGVMRLYYPAPLQKLSQYIVNPQAYMLVGVVCGLIGLFLCFHGFIAR